MSEIPSGPGWLYEPKWDGFRCLAFRYKDAVLLQSKAGQPLGRYFPEVVAALRSFPQRRFVLDGEIAIFSAGQLSFDDLLLRIHPAESRIRKLSAATLATLMCFDLLVNNDGKLLTRLPLVERRQKLEEFFSKVPPKGMVRLSPATTERSQAEQWMRQMGAIGLDGIIAKRLDEPYRSGERTAMVKIKRVRTADCVVGGFRYAEKGGGIGSLHQALHRMATAQDQVGLRGAVRSLFWRQISPWHKILALASRKETSTVYV